MKKNVFYLFIALELFVMFSFTFVNASITYPEPTALKYINDYNSVIDLSTKEYLIAVGNELEAKTGAQEVVVIIDSLKGEDLNNYTNELFRTWGIGQKDKNNGLLIFLSIKDRKWRVEVGTGLEGILPDIYTARVMDSVAKPKFVGGNYSLGIKEVYSIFASDIAKETGVTLNKNENIKLQDKGNIVVNKTTALFWSILFVVFIIFDFIFNRGKITFFIMSIAFWSGRHGGGGFGGKNDGGSGGGGFGGMGGGSSSGGGSSGGW